MKVITYKENQLKILGIKILRKKLKEGLIIYYFLYLPIFYTKSKFYSIYSEYKKNTVFDTKSFDIAVQSFIDKYVVLPINKNQLDNQKVLLIATELYDSGGHTECIKNLVAAVPESYKTALFLTKMNYSLDSAPIKLAEISKYIKISGIEQSISCDKSAIKKLISTYNKIISQKPMFIISFLHMDDIFGVALLAMIKKYTDIRVLFWNHASHYPTLGMAFADLIFEGTATTEQMTKELRGYSNTKIIGLPYLKEENIPIFNSKLIRETRKKIGIPNTAMCTMTGCASYKLFDGNESPYFQLIKRLLIKEDNLYHVVISQFNEAQQAILNRIFDNSELLKKIVFLPFTTEYKLLFRCCDLFIDSFPVSSALTHVDLMSLKVPNVIKINKNRPEFSFHEYLPPDYEYMFEDVNEMEKAISYLLHNEKERELITAANYQYFLETFEGKRSVQKIFDMMNF
ncbi:glycosyltransferase [Orbus mooreae]|uniref:glycosyltransferase n=1 Tax=Orbus mooreae TaxID=3074107 RepID=UPI00370D85C5